MLNESVGDGVEDDELVGDVVEGPDGVGELVAAAVALFEKEALSVDCAVILADGVPLALAPCDNVVVGVPLRDDDRESVDDADSLTELVRDGVLSAVPLPVPVAEGVDDGDKLPLTVVDGVPDSHEDVEGLAPADSVDCAVLESELDRLPVLLGVDDGLAVGVGVASDVGVPDTDALAVDD